MVTSLWIVKLNERKVNMKTREKAQEKYKKFRPQEGERVLVSLSNSAVCEERIFVYINKAGIYMCVHVDDEDCYENGEGCGCFRVSGWTSAKPLPPKKLPEFIKGDPVVVWGPDGTELIRIVDHVAEDCTVKCLTVGWAHYRPLKNYDYGGRNVFEV
jgi:hypothetical protein